MPKVKPPQYRYYHTGTDSFDNPEIKRFEKNSEPRNFGWGPFASWKAAHADFLRMIESDIRNLQDVHDKLHKMKDSKK
jgi:hypothetical protein